MAGTTKPFCNINSFPFECPYILGAPARLYMREGGPGPGGITYEVSRGEEVNFVGMTRDGSKVYFTTTAQLIPGTGEGQDNDTSLDLYQWSPEGDKLTLISREGGLGNNDNCSATWVEKCGVQPLTPQFMNYSELFEQKARVQGIDDVMANDSGDIYFYSPQDLVPGEVGGDGQRNLYLYRNGHLHLVTTFEPGQQVERSTISLEGTHAAFMTRSNLTAYDSEGQQEVYAYDADTGILRCASCNPAGTPAQQSAQTVTVSEAGPFMSDDGRVFFGSREALVPQDTDGIRDVYEYVNGRPQLITSGTGQRESTGGLETVSIFFGNVQIGLESVSRDGTDVYFSSFETLTPEDHNGSFLKFYDARSGGGFDFNPDLGPCAAADECHGASSQPPTPAQTGSGGKLGASGNLPARTKRHKKPRHHKRAHKKHGKRHGSHRNG
jgi:guanyl-specific ribonuclease Sa